MAFTDFVTNEFIVEMEYSGQDVQSVEAASGGGTLEISRYGGVLLNPYDATWKYSEAAVPNRAAAFNTADRQQAPHDLIVRGQFWSTSAYLLYGNMSLWMKTLENFSASPYLKYLTLAVTGAGAETMRRYIESQQIVQQIISQSEYRALQPYTLRLRSLDPHWHGNTVRTETISVTGGSASHAMTTEGNHNPTHVFWEIRRDSADVDTPTIANDAGDSMTINATLTAGTSHYLVDAYQGLVRKGTSNAWASGSVARADFSGDYVRPALGSETIDISVGSGTPDFTVVLTYLDRLF